MKIEENKLGKISINEDILRKLVIDEIISISNRDYVKKIFLSNPKGKKVSKYNTATGIKFTFNIDNKTRKSDVEILVYLILKFGTSIKSSTGLIGNSIKTTIEKNIGIDVSKIKFVITGIELKSIVKKELEVIQVYDVK